MYTSHLRWDPALQQFVGEWAPGNGYHAHVTVAGAAIQAYIERALRDAPSHIEADVRQEAMDISIWIEGDILAREAGLGPLPGVTVTEGGREGGGTQELR